jgi:hypothetical protein
MDLTQAEQQLVHILRAAKNHKLTLTVLVRAGRYTVSIDPHGSPGGGHRGERNLR